MEREQRSARHSHLKFFTSSSEVNKRGETFAHRRFETARAPARAAAAADGNLHRFAVVFSACTPFSSPSIARSAAYCSAEKKAWPSAARRAIHAGAETMPARESRPTV
jgi:hypothetical protein